jgi:hypothetical protein
MSAVEIVAVIILVWLVYSWWHVDGLTNPVRFAINNVSYTAQLGEYKMFKSAGLGSDGSMWLSGAILIREARGETYLIKNSFAVPHMEPTNVDTASRQNISVMSVGNNNFVGITEFGMVGQTLKVVIIVSQYKNGWIESNGSHTVIITSNDMRNGHQ